MSSADTIGADSSRVDSSRVDSSRVDSPGIDCDLLVVGGGAAGLSAAVTAAYHGLKVIVAEKADTLGGASAWSGVGCGRR
jgi:NADPH-dependent 2,4-dienoyl-CoA reductase/sulfur reductase-like enzyme